MQACQSKIIKKRRNTRRQKAKEGSLHQKDKGAMEKGIAQRQKRTEADPFKLAVCALIFNTVTVTFWSKRATACLHASFSLFPNGYLCRAVVSKDKKLDKRTVEKKTKYYSILD